MMKIFKIENLDNLNKDKIIKSVNKNGFAIIRGLFKKKEMNKSLKTLKLNYNTQKDKSSLKGSAKQIFNNFQKLCIGSSALSGEKIYRFHRIIYNPTWSNDLYGFRKIFLKFNIIRNIILGFDRNFCVYKPEKKMWSACRILQYPTGGGHMSLHKDYVLKTVSKINFSNKFYQLILLVSQKGRDFKKGGAYIKKKNKLIDLERNSLSGDILIYKTDILHSVEEIDPQKKIDLSKINGRVVLMNSLYQNFNESLPKDQFFKK